MDDTLFTGSEIDPPETLRELTRSEHLLVWALRTIVIGHDDCPILEGTFREACGPLGGQALTTYHAVVKLIAMAGRRRLQVHVPGCACVSADEKAIVGVISAAQESLGGDETVLKSHIAALLGVSAPQTLVMAAQAVGGILQSRGYRLPHRDLEEITASEPQPTLH